MADDQTELDGMPEKQPKLHLSGNDYTDAASLDADSIEVGDELRCFVVLEVTKAGIEQTPSGPAPFLNGKLVEPPTIVEHHPAL